MGTVGINFGSATSGTGFDVTATVTNIVTKLKAVETPWTSQLTSMKAQDTAFTSIGTDLAALSTSLLSLTDFQGVMASKLGSSSYPNILSLDSAGPTAVAGSHTVVVSQLAQTSSQYSDPLPASDLVSGALTIQVGTGNAHVIPVVGGSSDTLATYAAAINSADVGVSASVISDTAGSRLSLVSKTSGAAGQLTVTSGGSVPATTTDGVTTPGVTYGVLTDATGIRTGTPIGFISGLDGQDAELTVDNRSVDSASNTISTAIPGVTFQLLASDPLTTVQVQVANDKNSIETAFSALVTAYNKIVTDIKTQEGNDASGNPEPLFGNTILSQIQSSLSLALTSGTASGSVSSLYQLGISANPDGTLKLDTSMLDSELNSNYSDVVGFLQNAGSFGQTLSTALDQAGNSSPTGAITLALSANSSQETTLKGDISNQDNLIASQQASLTAELNTANEILQAIPQQLNEMNMLYSAMTGYNTGNG